MLIKYSVCDGSCSRRLHVVGDFLFVTIKAVEAGTGDVVVLWPRERTRSGFFLAELCNRQRQRAVQVGITSDGKSRLTDGKNPDVVL